MQQKSMLFIGEEMIIYKSDTYTVEATYAGVKLTKEGRNAYVLFGRNYGSTVIVNIGELERGLPDSKTEAIDEYLSQYFPTH